MRNILVTGAAGFIGSHLIDELLKDEDNFVIGIDDGCSSTGENLDHIKGHMRFYFIYYDIVNPRIFSMRIDLIYHLACPASPVYYQKDPMKTLDTCYTGTRNMLELAKSKKCPILFTSTSEIYGEPLVHPQSEGYRGNVNPIGPRAIYDEGKRVAETMMTAYHTQYDVDIRIARIFNTYGPRLMRDDGRVVSNFITQALAGEPITLYGDGTQTRSFCYISDTVRGLMMLMDSGITTPINIGNPNEITVFELATRILLLTDSDSVMMYGDLPIDDPSRRKPNINKAGRLLGWKPEVGLTAGLKSTISYFKEK